MDTVANMSALYFQVIRRDLVRAVRRKRPEIELETIILHQDNAPPHRAASTLMDIDFLGFERLEHSPYSPYLEPMDFEIFSRLKVVRDPCQKITLLSLKSKSVRVIVP